MTAENGGDASASTETNSAAKNISGATSSTRISLRHVTPPLHPLSFLLLMEWPVHHSFIDSRQSKTFHVRVCHV